MTAKYIYEIGQRYNNLVIIGRTSERDKQGQEKWLFKCDCGNDLITVAREARRGAVKSCGCLQKTAAARNGKLGIVHGLSKSDTYSTWRSMKKRCTLVSNIGYKDYGGRGIKICERWMKFENFLSDMGERPKGMQLDRIDNRGHYEPGNCRWTTPKQNCNNKRNCIYVELSGETKTLAEWADHYGISRQTVYWRYRMKWPIDKVLLND